MDAHTEPMLPYSHGLILAPTFAAEVMPAHGWDTLTDAARACGLSHTTLLRLSRGEVAPGHRIIAALMAATGEPFERLFCVT